MLWTRVERERKRLPAVKVPENVIPKSRTTRWTHIPVHCCKDQDWWVQIQLLSYNNMMLESSASNSHWKTIRFFQDCTIHSTAKMVHLSGTAKRAVWQARGGGGIPYLNMVGNFRSIGPCFLHFPIPLDPFLCPTRFYWPLLSAEKNRFVSIAFSSKDNLI